MPIYYSLIASFIPYHQKCQKWTSRSQPGPWNNRCSTVKIIISTILLTISLYINTKLESRELVDILSSLSFADDYKEVLRLSDALLPTQEKDYNWEGALVNFALDNADINTRTLTGHNTWHALGGIASKTPAGEHVEPTIQRSTKIRCATDAGMFGEIALKVFEASKTF